MSNVSECVICTYTDSAETDCTLRSFKIDSSTGVFKLILKFFEDHFFYRSPPVVTSKMFVSYYNCGHNIMKLFKILI